jgi:hypothetical protein
VAVVAVVAAAMSLVLPVVVVAALEQIQGSAVQGQQQSHLENRARAKPVVVVEMD